MKIQSLRIQFYFGLMKRISGRPTWDYVMMRIKTTNLKCLQKLCLGKLRDTDNKVIIMHY